MQLPVSDDSHSQWTAERDIEQQDEALSPIDGYFHAYDSSRTTASAAVPSVPDVFVNDPSLVGDEERHVRGSQRPVGNESIVRSSPSANQHLHRPSIKDPASPSSSHTSPPGSSYQQASVSHLPTNRAIGETRSPDAPPAYQTLAGGGREAPLTSVGTPSVMGVPEEQQRLLPLSHPREPQSMGGSPSDGNNYPQRRTLCQRLIAILVGAVLVVSIISLVHGGPFGHKAIYSIPENNDHSTMEWSPAAQCYNSPHAFPKITKTIDFTSGKSLSVFEVIDRRDGPHNGRQPHVFGELIVKRAEGANVQASGQLDIEVISNDEGVEAQFTYDERAQKYTVTVPRSVYWRVSNWSPCIQIRITVWAPSDAVLDSLNIDLVHLDIDIKDGVQLNAAGGAVLKSVSGKVNAPTNPHGFQSRNIEISTVSGDINGWYPLYDLLRVHSVSGTIRVDVGHKTVDAHHPKPATLDASTNSGDITVTGSGAGGDFAARDYVSSIKTDSGTIKAKVPFSSSGEFETKSATLDLDLTPVLDTGGHLRSTKLSTNTMSGTTRVVVRSPQWVHLDAATTSSEGQHVTDVSKALADLSSHHGSMSGGITLRYPSVWEGSFYADTMSGAQSFRGDGVQIDSRHGFVPKVVEGHKGAGRSRLVVKTMSGGQDFRVE
jgi:hypothetical protein